MQERETWRIWIVLVIALGLQTTWLATWRFFGVPLDLPLLCTVSVALLLGWETGAIFGAIAGLWTGYCAAFNAGTFAFSRAVAGAVLGGFDRKFSSDNLFAPSLGAAFAVVLSNAVFWIMAPTEWNWKWWAWRTFFGIILHAIAILPLHWLMAGWILKPKHRMFAA